ncbi:MAG: hypothetical protein H0W72_02935 [Planctomycetes bacterium]|nr:hypothetical protein [Planctomycetota bacterium]
MSRIDDNAHDHYRQESATIVADAICRQAGEWEAISTGGVLFCAEAQLRGALRALHEAERALEAISERADCPDLPTAGFGAAVSLLSKLHGAVRRAQ